MKWNLYQNLIPLARLDLLQIWIKYYYNALTTLSKFPGASESPWGWKWAGLVTYNRIKWELGSTREYTYQVPVDQWFGGHSLSRMYPTMSLVGARTEASLVTGVVHKLLQTPWWTPLRPHAAMALNGSFFIITLTLSSLRVVLPDTPWAAPWTASSSSGTPGLATRRRSSHYAPPGSWPPPSRLPATSSVGQLRQKNVSASCSPATSFSRVLYVYCSAIRAYFIWISFKDSFEWIWHR